MKSEILCFKDIQKEPSLIGRVAINAIPKFKKYVKAQNMQSFLIWKRLTSSNIIETTNENKPKIDEIKKYFQNKYFTISVPLNNERIRRQHGAFLLFGMSIEEQLNPFKKEAFDIKRHILIA